jgi:dihydropteroate synthase
MHQRSQFLPDADIIDDIISFWTKSIHIAKCAGILDANIVLDVGLGVGFKKTITQNFYILSQLSQLVAKFSQYEILLGASRKSFLEKLTGATHPRERDIASVAVSIYALRNGVRNFRVHNVRLTRNALL